MSPMSGHCTNGCSHTSFFFVVPSLAGRRASPHIAAGGYLLAVLAGRYAMLDLACRRWLSARCACGRYALLAAPPSRPALARGLCKVQCTGSALQARCRAQDNGTGGGARSLLFGSHTVPAHLAIGILPQRAVILGFSHHSDAREFGSHNVSALALISR